MSAELSLTRLATLYGVLQATYTSFKALHRRRRYVSLIAEHNAKCARGEEINGPALLARIDRLEIVPHLQFWTVLAMVHLYDLYFEVFFSWIPFYSLGKAFFLLFIIVPQTRGAVFVFDTLVAPQMEKRTRWIDDVLAPAVRGVGLRFAHRILHFTLDHALGSISSRELQDMAKQIDSLLRDVTREGYLRRREESIQAFSESIPEEKHRTALLDEILREFPDGDDAAIFTSLELESTVEGVRLRGEADDDEDDDESNNKVAPREFRLAEYIQMMRIAEEASKRS